MKSSFKPNYGFVLTSNYSNDQNTGLVLYAKGRKLSDSRMVRYSDAIFLPSKYQTNLSRIQMIFTTSQSLGDSKPEYRTPQLSDIQLNLASGCPIFGSLLQVLSLLKHVATLL